MVVKVTEKEHMAIIVAAEKRKAVEPKPKVKAKKVKVNEQNMQEVLTSLKMPEPFDLPEGSRIVGHKPKSLKTIMINPDEAHLIESGVKIIEQKHKDCINHASAAFTIAAEIGDLLYHIKSLLKHGEFTRWVATTMPFVPRTARNYMTLFRYREDLLRKGVTSIVDAYAAIRGVAAPDEDIDDDDSDNTKGKMVVVDSTVDLDNEKLPTKKAEGPIQDMYVGQNTIDDMRKQKYRKGTYRKLVVRLPIRKGNEKLIGDFVTLAQTLLKPGGKLIFHREVRKDKW